MMEVFGLFLLILVEPKIFLKSKRKKKSLVTTIKRISIQNLGIAFSVFFSYAYISLYARKLLKKNWEH